jgi:putative aminopeptidase FrvX
LATALVLALTAVACGGGNDNVSVPTQAPTSITPHDSSPVTPSRTFATTPALDVDLDAVLADVRSIAALGPREATSGAYRRAAAVVEQRLEALGYQVRRQAFAVPSGTLDGVRLLAGESENVIAEPRGFDASRPHVVVGAHLDTAPRSPGGNDNASGVAAMLELARLAKVSRPRVPVVFVAFGAEEPRRPNGNRWGSKAYVAAMGKQQRQQVAGVINLDAIGVGSAVPVCVGGRVSQRLQQSLLKTAKQAGVPAKACTTRASDHQSFELAGLPAVLLGGADYPQYHTRNDRASVVGREPAARAVRLAWATIR